MYSVNFDNKKVELPKYSIELALKIEELDNFEGSIADGLKRMYDFISEVIGLEKTEELLGEFTSSDPNLINILFLQIVNEYNKPLQDYTIKRSTQVLDNPKVKQSLDAITKVVEANND